MMRTSAMILAGLLLILAVMPLSAWQPEATVATGGAKACLDCHDNPAVNGILQSSHFVAADPRTPAANNACQSCHGPSKEHMEFPLQIANLKFGSQSMLGVEAENAVCQDCHASDHPNWAMSTHAAEEVSCASCHSVHTPHDPVLDPAREVEVCESCHLQQKIEVNKPYRHPVREGVVVCSSCHDPHGSDGLSELRRETVNETCFQCHADKRGPFVNEHEPVVDDCMNCHTPHGSNHESLLTVRPPFLCQQCHGDFIHSTEAYDFEDLPGGSGNHQLRVVGQSCVNCHSEVHGSNRPGARSFLQ